MSLAPLAIALLALVGGAPARPEARERLAAGNRLFEAGRFDEAISEYRLGYGIEPSPDFLYAIGQAARRKGDCATAIEYYRRYAAGASSPRQVEAARAQIERCERERPAPGAPPPATSSPPPPRTATAAAPAAAAPAPSAPASATRAQKAPLSATLAPGPALAAREVAPASGPPPPPDRPSVAGDLVGGLLVGGGAVAAGVGVVLVLQARSAVEAASESYERYLEAREARGRSIAGWIAVGAGGALLAGGVVRYVWLAGHREPARLGAAPLPLPGGGGLVLAGRF